MNTFSEDLLKTLKLLKYKYEAWFLLANPEEDINFPFIRIYLSEADIKHVGITIAMIDVIHGSINRLLEIPNTERVEWYDVVGLSPVYNEPIEVVIPENYLAFTISPKLDEIIRKVETNTQQNITYYDSNKSMLVINGIAHKISRKSDKSNAHYILKYIFEHDPKEEHSYSEMEEENILGDNKEWDTYYKSLNAVKDKLDKELGIKDFFEKITTGKSGSVKIHSKYL